MDFPAKTGKAGQTRVGWSPRHGRSAQAMDRLQRLDPAGLKLGLGIDVFTVPTRSLTVLTVSYTHGFRLNLKQILMR